MKKRIVLIGAGSANFGLGTLGDILKSKVLEGSHIVLHDINPEALARVETIGRNYIQEHGLPFEVSATIDRKEALKGADFCVISIEVGNRFELWDQDWKIPMQYGIRQVYGENGGPGGLFHSLRIIPPILEICGDIMAICPDAYVFNFSNPMSRICTTVMRKYPYLKLVGLCHEIASLPHHLPAMLGTSLENLTFRAGGLNHFSVLLSVHYNDTGKDAYPDVRAKAVEYFKSQPGSAGGVRARLEPGALSLAYNDGQWAERGLFKYILETFDYLPITTDSHFGEYIPWAQSIVDHNGIIEFYEAYRKWCAIQVSGGARISGTSEDWTVVKIMEGILTNACYEEAAVNTLNHGLIDNLPADIAVETPALVDKNGVHGIPLGKLSKGIGGLFNNQYPVHDLTAEAVLTGSRKAALQALLVDPVVHSATAAEQTLDTILRLQEKYLGYLK
jgi:alpha-galactosidase